MRFNFLVDAFIDQRVTIITKPEYGIGETFSIDAVINETHANKSLMTDNPIEDGTSIADHIAKQPISIELNGVFSDTPISKNIPFAPLFTAYPGRARDMYDKMFQMRQDFTSFTLITGIKAYINMYIVELAAQRQKGDGLKIGFNAKIKKALMSNIHGGLVGGQAVFDVQHTVVGLQSLGAKMAF